MTENLESLWISRFGNTPPLGFILRRDYPDQWIRLHALPKSKRYAETSTERKIILKRANVLLRELFGTETKIWLLSSRYVHPEGVTDHAPGTFAWDFFNLQKAFTSIDQMEEKADQFPISTYAKEIEWPSHILDTVFQKVADEEEYGIILASSDLKSWLAPYDGGFDIFSSAAGLLETLSMKYSSWRSSHPHGL